MTCGNDCDVRTFVGLEDDDVSEFSLSSSKLTALACYHRCLQAWAYQGNARVDDASHAYDLGFSIVEK